MLYTLDCGAVASKPTAARWARQTLGPRWAALIAGTLAVQHDQGETLESDIRDTVALVEYTVERSRQRETPAPPGAERNGRDDSR